ncbi:dead box rna helicase [Nannochloropsis gaditana CCMP526]|uniref:dead box rna helicase n=1 Tax=Nannochloropsis gaditana (strain CCMP526) TaxID=1093141 RepID=UPI00029F69E4|nr:dead box rna helicase [Nannochloropsis gaditana CCMP526]EKU22967.1 dead box rna helicase [Nannochloropsis gaditana CCMP526]|eukprot:XP_005853396.1 dead box rna helicase [Nannochloropsis gaditana CCMP526]
MGGSEDKRKKRKLAKEQTTEALDRSDPKASKKKCKKKKKQDAASSCPSARPSEVSDPIMGKDELSMKEEEKEARERKLRKKAKKESKRAAELLKISEAETAETEVKEPADKLLNGTTNEKQDEQSSISRLSKEERKRAKKEKKKQEKIAAATSHATPLPSTPCTADAPHPLSKSEAQAWWEENEILVSGPGCDAFLPTLSFAGVGFPPDLLKCTEGFARPTPIQAQCWPVLMGGRDIIGIAETGSGKTLTFILPGLERIRKAGAPDGGRAGHVPRMLVVAPTRELAMQSAEVIDGVVEGSGLRSICLFGGVPKQEQRQALRGGVDILVATPGRLADLMEEGECDLSRVSYLVLDEADRMLDQGFEQAIRGIVSHCVPRGRRQTALFSATWPVAIQALAGEFLENPVKVTIGGEDLSSNKRVQQVVEVVGEFEREGRLRGLLTQYHGRRDNRVLVFALYKKAFMETRARATASPPSTKFKTKEVPLLVATDVAARGLDIPDVEVVINYSFPLTIEDYVHRIGRTGRAGKKGIAHTFFHQGDKGNAGALVNTLRQAGQEVPPALLKFGTAVKKKEHKLYGAFGPREGMEEKKATKIVFADD